MLMEQSIVLRAKLCVEEGITSVTRTISFTVEMEPPRELHHPPVLS